jgi:hypothetical protein
MFFLKKRTTKRLEIIAKKRTKKELQKKNCNNKFIKLYKTVN